MSLRQEGLCFIYKRSLTRVAVISPILYYSDFLLYVNDSHHK